MKSPGVKFFITFFISLEAESGNAVRHTWGPEDGTQDARPGGKSLYPLSHLVTSIQVFKTL